MAVPGVLGVFAVEPNDAKAPVPSPKAEEAPDVGEATPVVVSGDMPLRVPLFPSPPKRFAAEYVRDESGLVLSLVLLELDVDSESLLVLHCRVQSASPQASTC